MFFDRCLPTGQPVGKRILALAGFLVGFGLPLHAGSYFCNGREVSSTVRTCPDGTPPRFVAEVTKRPEPPPCEHKSVFGREWRLFIGGASYVTENNAQGTRTLHVGAGTGNLPLTVTISPDGNYVWKAYDKTIRGQWKPGKEDYPVVLQNGYEGKNWFATIHRCQLLLWDGKTLAGQFSGR